GGTNGGAPVTVFSDAFESGLGTWYAENGLWEVGTPTVEPVGCYEGTSCASTILDGDAPGTSSRLISPRVTLPTLEPGEELQLRFWHWFQFSGSGQVEVSAWDEGTSAWLEWQAAGDPVGDSAGSGGWSRKGVDLAAYAGQQVRFGFSYDQASVYPGWTVDGFEIVRFTPDFSVDFELGWGDWYADNGSWQVGLPTAGPAACHGGVSCAGTVLDGDAPSTDSRLISPTVTLPEVGGQNLQLRFWNWFDISGSGQVQITVWDEGTSTWGAWQNIDTPVFGTSTSWTLKAADLTAFGGQRVRIAFFYQPANSHTGWYIDDLSFVLL
ncbi:MAG TPA: choice-of-anchor J domain-containing protein, partial [Polyangiaceae bacterium]|nr:choice-of-anchor J domain-containing protein [Polyangiaceae bacterium]